MPFCTSGTTVKNRNVSGGRDYQRPPPSGSDGECTIHMLICALDYKQTSKPLTCTIDGKNMEKLAHASGVQDLECMWDEECQKEAVSQKIRDVGSRCGEDDYFIFYYAGHGANLKDYSGDEEDGQDEAFCFVDQQGQISYETVMTDDDFSDVITESLPAGVRIVILTDCCHSGTIADLSKDQWQDLEVVSIAGCMDCQTSEERGKGGIFTHSMLLAIEKLAGDEQDEYSAGLLFNATLAFDDKVFDSAQDITIQCSSSTTPSQFAWPLVPQDGYTAPLTQRIGAVDINALVNAGNNCVLQ